MLKDYNHHIHSPDLRPSPDSQPAQPTSLAHSSGSPSLPRRPWPARGRNSLPLLQIESMEDQEFTLFLQNLQRAINCLTDQDRNIRTQGLTTLEAELRKSPQHYRLRLFESSHLGRNLMHTLRDPIEKNRELALNVIELVVQGSSPLRKEESETIIKELVLRVNATPYPERSEALRERILVLLKACLKFRDSFTANISEAAVAMAVCLADQSSQIKNYACQLIDRVCEEQRAVIGKYSQGIVRALSDNLKHNKHQVRKTTLVTISKLLVTEGAGGNLEHLLVPLKASLSDPKIDVRRTALESVGVLLKLLGPKYLKQHESTLVSLLLIGLSDENEENSRVSQRMLSECGGSIREMEGEGRGESEEEGRMESEASV